MKNFLEQKTPDEYKVPGKNLDNYFRGKIRRVLVYNLFKRTLQLKIGVLIKVLQEQLNNKIGDPLFCYLTEIQFSPQ
jgi:hypothetical protein